MIGYHNYKHEFLFFLGGA